MSAVCFSALFATLAWAQEEPRQENGAVTIVLGSETVTLTPSMEQFALRVVTPLSKKQEKDLAQSLALKQRELEGYLFKPNSTFIFPARLDGERLQKFLERTGNQIVRITVYTARGSLVIPTNEIFVWFTQELSYGAIQSIADYIGNQCGLAIQARGDGEARVSSPYGYPVEFFDRAMFSIPAERTADVFRVIEALRQNGWIRSAEPNFIVQIHQF